MQATTRYVGGGEDETRKELQLPINETEDVIYLDLSTLYTFGSEDKYGFTFGISNALDRDPPRVIDGFSNTALGTYDVFGRRFFAAFRARY
jgi:outer membrane receptor protein involved in Fe transport